VTKHTLIYFPAPGRGEPIRDAFKLGKIEFTDERVPFDKFRQMKEAGELPFGSFPVLVVDGTPPRRIAQSNAILRYVGKLAALYPTDPVEALRVDEITDAAEDINSELAPSMREQDMEKKLAMRKPFAEQRVPHWARALEKRLDDNGNNGFFVGSSLTIADLKMLYVVEKLVDGSLDGIPKTALDPFEKLSAWAKNVRSVRNARIG
jgi:prostaglandin-H2 D-isomerase / glutathione transferase